MLISSLCSYRKIAEFESLLCFKSSDCFLMIRLLGVEINADKLSHRLLDCSLLPLLVKANMENLLKKVLKLSNIGISHGGIRKTHAHYISTLSQVHLAFYVNVMPD